MDKNADFTEQPLRCHVELTLVGEVLEECGSSKNPKIGNLSQGSEDAIVVDDMEEDGKRCEAKDMDDKRGNEQGGNGNGMKEGIGRRGARERRESREQR